MVRFNCVILFICLWQFSFAQDRVAEIREKLLSRDQHSVIVASHRGDWRNAPENSLAAIDNAIDMGVDIVEIDVQRTQDGQLILMHDNTLNRTSTGKGAVSGWTLDSLRNLRLKNGAGIRTKHSIPTLEEALVHTKGKVMLNLDKASPYFDQIFLLLEKTGTTRQIVMKGTETPEQVKAKFGNYLSDIIYMPIVNLDHKDAHKHIQEFVSDLHPVAFELLFKQDANPLPKEVKTMLAGKSLIWYNTLWDTMAGGHDDDMALEKPDAAYGYLIDTLGARLIQTDRPAYLIDYLKKRNLHD